MPNAVGPDYFPVVGLRILRARTFNEADLEGDGRNQGGVRAAVRGIDPGLPAPMYPLEANLERARTLSGLVTTVAGALGGLALVLAAVGIHGVVSAFLGRRFREIGIRFALGAGAASIYRLVLTRTLRPGGVGAAFGVAGALVVSGVLSSVLFGVSPLDPLGITGAALFVLAVALGSGYWAARRAGRLDPIETLRHE
ncbi:MAG TPA: FtsX-like permease family protein [Gammaproteobacteria bacterium]|nr:FtsX-like permease family protein [Gammaproteobacteria bacterium]